MLGKIDHGVIVLAAILTICGFLLAFLPWRQLPVVTMADPAPIAAPAEPAFHAEPGEVAVGLPAPKDKQTEPAKPK